MQNLVLSPIDPQILIDKIAEKVTSKVLQIVEKNNAIENSTKDNPIDDYIPRKEIVDVLASASTLWKLEKEGKIIAYGIRGKRFYKRKDIEKLFTPLKK